jgi:hypothetical protein
MEKKSASLSLHKETLKTLKLKSSVKTGLLSTFHPPGATTACPTRTCNGNSDCLLDPNL